MNGGKSFDASSQDNQGLILAVSFAAIFGTVIIFGVAIAIGLWFYKSRTSKRRPQENLAQQDSEDILYYHLYIMDMYCIYTYMLIYTYILIYIYTDIHIC